MAGFGFKVEVKGLNRVRNNLRRTASKMPKIVQEEAYPWGQSVRKRLRSTPYPPKLPNQKYKRTGRLGRSWSARKSRGGVEIRNLAKDPRYGRRYAGYVVGDTKGEGQAGIHQGRWWIAREKVEEYVGEFTKALTKRLKKELTK